MTIIQVKQIIGQLNASIIKIEPELNVEEFREYCDAVSTLITYWKIHLKKLNEDG
jgi:hypothetical protein